MRSNLVTIGIPCCNEEPYITKCLISAIQQDIDTSYNVIVSDNASTDKTIEKIWGALDKHCPDNCTISVIENRKNIGASENFKLVFDLAESKYFMWLGAHDYITKDFLKNSIDFLESNKDHSMVSGIPYRIYLNSGESLRERLKKITQKNSNWRKKGQGLLNLSNNKIEWYGEEAGWKGPEIAPEGIYDFSQNSSFRRYLKSVDLLVNCTIFHSVFKRDLLTDYDWGQTPSADHIIISRLLWHGKLGFSDAGYIRRYFPKEDRQEKKAAGSYAKNATFFGCYLSDFEKLAAEAVDSPVLNCLSQLVFDSLAYRYGIPQVNLSKDGVA